MGDELAEPSSPQWERTAGFANPSQQWRTWSGGFHTGPGSIVLGNNRFRLRVGGVSVDVDF